MLRLVTRTEINARLLLEPLIDVLSWMGVHHRRFIFTAEDPYLIYDDYISEQAWLDRHLVCDDEGVLLRVL